MSYVDENRRRRYARPQYTRSSRAADTAGNAAAGGALVVARVIGFLFGAAATIIVVAIIMRLCNANPHNGVVSWFHTTGSRFSGPFHGLFSIHNLKASMLVNWGLAAIVISAVGGFLASIVARMGLAAAR